MKVKSLFHSISGREKTKLIQDQIRATLNQPRCWGVLDISKSNSKTQNNFSSSGIMDSWATYNICLEHLVQYLSLKFSYVIWWSDYTRIACSYLMFLYCLWGHRCGINCLKYFFALHSFAFEGKQHSNFIFQSKHHAGVYQQLLVSCSSKSTVFLKLYEQPFQTTLLSTLVLTALCTQAKFWKSLATFSSQGCNSLKQKKKKQNFIHPAKEREFQMAGSPPSHFFPPHTALVRGQRVTEIATVSAAFTEIQLHAAKGLEPNNFA